MAKLYFNYGPMNSGKSQDLINTVYNYRNQGNKRCLVFTTALDTRSSKNMVQSRTGASLPARYLDDDIFDLVQKEANKEFQMKNGVRVHSPENIVYAIVVDEAQFLTRQQVLELTRIVDELNIPVICFGLRSDFQGNLFPGSEALFALADQCSEAKTICFMCSVNKATMNLRLDKYGNPINKGQSIMAGDNYVPVCRKCYKKSLPNWEDEA